MNQREIKGLNFEHAPQNYKSNSKLDMPENPKVTPPEDFEFLPGWSALGRYDQFLKIVLIFNLLGIFWEQLLALDFLRSFRKFLVLFFHDKVQFPNRTLRAYG